MRLRSQKVYDIMFKFIGAYFLVKLVWELWGCCSVGHMCDREDKRLL